MLLVVLGLFALAVAEISVLVALSNATSWVVTLLVLILVGAAGAWIVKREGTSAWRRVAASVRTGEVPTTSVLDGLLLMVAGFLLLLPGLLSDLLALALAVPQVRAKVRDALTARLQRRIAARASNARATIFGFGAPGATFGGFSGFGTGFGGADGASGRRGRFDDDIIDLDGEEVDLTDLTPHQIEPPRDRSA